MKRLLECRLMGDGKREDLGFRGKSVCLEKGVR